MSMPVFMKVDGVEGSATGKYKGWIELQYYYGPPTLQDHIQVGKKSDQADIPLINLRLRFESKNVRIDFAKTDGILTVYSRINLEGVMFADFITGQSEGTTLLGMKLQYTKLTYETTFH
jgi:type VI protein secretion system component Hcp